MLGKVIDKKVDYLVCPVRLAVILLTIKYWTDNLLMMGRNCFCLYYVTTQIIF